ncbi:hypothetical protein, partial [Marinobacter salarius]
MHVNSKKIRWLLAVVLAGMVSGCENSELAPATPADSHSVPTCIDITAEDSTQINMEDIRVEAIATGLEVPWDLEVLDDGRVL